MSAMASNNNLSSPIEVGRDGKVVMTQSDIIQNQTTFLIFFLLKFKLKHKVQQRPPNLLVKIFSVSFLYSLA